jgi:hypothetical protein
MKKNTLSRPDPFLVVRVERIDLDPKLQGLCAGYENGRWRYDQLASHLVEWLPEFALNWKERQGLNDSNAVQLLKKAARRVYTTNAFQKRGEIGELLLHAVLRQINETFPAISKIYYKDSSNDTVKGFDAVHCADNGDGLELWIGEVKYYKSISKAISDVVVELEKHTKIDYLRDEFSIISDKLDPYCPFYNDLKALIHRNKSMDEIFLRVIIPVLLTYESDTVNGFDKISKEYDIGFKVEIMNNYKKFINSAFPKELKIKLMLLPLHTKVDLSHSFDRKLKGLQAI